MSSDKDLIYAKFRYTLLPGIDVDETYVDDLLTKIINKVLRKDMLSDITVGYEDETKLGTPSWPHIHIAFSTSGQTLKQIRGRFRTNILIPTMDKRQRTKAYSLKQVANMRDAVEFYRYPIKQKHPFAVILQKHNSITSIDFNFEHETHTAHDEYRRTIEFNQAKLAKTLKPNAYDKIEKHLVGLGLYQPTEREIIGHISKFALANRLPCDFAKMMTHCNTYRYLHGLMDHEEVIDAVLKFK